MPERPPDKPFNYVLERRLAAGGMGEVFLAKDKTSGKVCVIKRMLPNLMADAQFVSMFLDEARLAAQLNHPNIAPLYDFGMASGVLYLAMEYVPGANLRVIVKDHTARKAKVPFDPAARVLSQAALALDYAHQAKTADGKPLKLVHRDVSPQNILLGSNGVVKLIDFGVAKAATASQVTAAGLIKGKYAYMSPEQLRGQTLDGRSDIFGLGLVLYELLAAERAIPGKTDAEVAQNALHMRFAPIKQKRPDIPERLEQIIAKALEKDVRERYQRAADFSSDLERFLAERRVSPTGDELVKLLPRPPPGTATQTPNVPWPNEPPPEAKQPERMWAPTQDTPAFWENHPIAPTDMSTEDGLPPTQQLTPSQLPVKSPPAPDPSEAPTQFAEDVKLPPPPPSRPPEAKKSAPPPMPAPRAAAAPPPAQPVFQLPPPPAPDPVSETAIQRAIRRGMMPWILSAAVLIFGTGALIWGFLLMQHRNAQQVPPTVTGQPQPQPLPPQPEPAPTPEPAPPPTEVATADSGAATEPPKPVAIDSALVTVVSSIPCRVSVDGAASTKAPLEVSLSPGQHAVVFEDLATGLKHKRMVSVGAGERRKESWNPERGKLLVRASPWAEVFVGDHSFGVTPMDAPVELVAGRHNFRFVNTDTRRTVQRIVDVAPGKETLVKVDMR